MGFKIVIIGVGIGGLVVVVLLVCDVYDVILFECFFVLCLLGLGLVI